MLKIPCVTIEILTGKIYGHFLPSFSCFSTRCLLQPEQRTLVYESGMIKIDMGDKIEQKMVAVACDALSDTTPQY
jgi:hypothetical protein